MPQSHTYAIVRTGLAARPRIMADQLTDSRAALATARTMAGNGGVFSVVRVPNGARKISLHSCALVAVCVRDARAKIRTLHIEGY